MSGYVPLHLLSCLYLRSMAHTSVLNTRALATGIWLSKTVRSSWPSHTNRRIVDIVLDIHCSHLSHLPFQDSNTSNLNGDSTSYQSRYMNTIRTPQFQGSTVWGIFSAFPTSRHILPPQLHNSQPVCTRNYFQSSSLLSIGGSSAFFKYISQLAPPRVTNCP